MGEPGLAFLFPQVIDQSVREICRIAVLSLVYGGSERARRIRVAQRKEFMKVSGLAGYRISLIFQILPPRLKLFSE